MDCTVGSVSHLIDRYLSDHPGQKHASKVILEWSDGGTIYGLISADHFDFISNAVSSVGMCN